MSESRRDFDGHWPRRQLGETGVTVGPCAWRVTMLRDPVSAAYVQQHPSLVVVMPDDDDALLAAAAEQVADLPVMLVVDEPDFARRFEPAIRSRLAALGAEQVAILAMLIDDPADLKGGGVMQVLFDLRQAGLCAQVGLGHSDARHAEWLARHTAVRILLTRYTLADQQVAYRALGAAAEHGMACINLEVTAAAGAGDLALRFALAQRENVLPVLDEQLPAGMEAMSEQEVARCWEAYQQTHEPPEPLLRSQPPQ